ncbi:molybdopterin cofactor-binding domain-containing protein [Flavobacterium hungaricum]|uniref:Xanthine dehydrogenase n=1 Tax=Flavobacterium hungaricum TaxID=2082725 RepID=A0ABR9TMK9_9FLAO|nr:molybdopterin cofactor-binding domain-containing protein [Flavobacterium hungaricum]MBE8726603.1 xanthine dehydrogenase [Flavobacterium hungaricum]
MKNTVKFFLNGKPTTIENPSPDLLLIDFLRSPEVGLSGPKKPCGQGGCGGCTVILSEWDGKENKANHLAINSCLRPVCAIGGLSVTTIEGTGAARKPDPKHFVQTSSSTRGSVPLGEDKSPVLYDAKKEADEKRSAVKAAIANSAPSGTCTAEIEIKEDIADFPSEETHSGINPVAYQLALNNGSQCGYCSVGFVMNMSEFIHNNPAATKKEIEQAFDGNLCRCTGYRSILTGMKTFASDWDAADEKKRMPCKLDPVSKAQLPGKLEIPFPPAAQNPASGVSTSRWTTPTSLSELAKTIKNNKNVRLVHANTSYGIYKNEYLEDTFYIDIRFIPELNTKNEVTDDHLEIAASTTYTSLIELLSEGIEKAKHAAGKISKSDSTTLEALDYMARRTAGRIVRNAATIGGNTMLVLKHIPKGTGEPFPSDLFTALYAVGTKINYFSLEKNGEFKAYTKSAKELVDAVVKDPELADTIVLSSYEISLKDSNAIVFAQKVALREVNAHSIVNTTTNFNIDDNCIIKSAVITFGGIAPFPWRAAETEKAMKNKELTLKDVNELSKILAKEVLEELIHQEERMEEVPNEGFTLEYRTQLAVSFFYKSVVNALSIKGIDIPANLKSAAENKWGNWPVSDGVQNYKTQDYKAPVAQPYIKVTAMYQTSGQTHYTHELPVPPLTLNGAFVQSQKALMNYSFGLKNEKIELSELKAHLKDKYPAFADIITHENIKNGGRNYQGMGNDQPLFAEQLVSYVGQSIAMILASSEQDAVKIASYVSTECVFYEKPGAPWTGEWDEPIIDLIEAIKKGSIFPDAPVSASFNSHIWKITRPGSQFDWVKNHQPIAPKTLIREKQIDTRTENVDNIPCTVVTSSQLCGGQAHFYMEPQACIATPVDEGRIKVQPSVQSPGGMHDTVASALGLYHHQVEVNVPPVGGGFGGKTEQTRFVAGPTAVAAKATKTPVRLAIPRDEDTAMIGKRHAYYGEYEIAVDTGEYKPENKGIIHGFQLKMWGDGGAFYDCSFIVSNCVQLRTDNAYKIKNFESQIDVCRTNTAPSTAMRAFGDVQGKNIVENAIDDAAISIGMRPEDLREKNLYDRGDVTPFGQALTYCYMKQVWSYAKDVSNFDTKYDDVQKFNRENKWVKRGISMLPVKYGSGYNLLALEQSAAIVAINPSDGTVVIHQGGVEIGQGLVTQAQQVAAYVLGIPMEMIFIDNVNTSITPNPTSTGGSTGTPYSCEAVKQTCEEMRARLMEFGYQMLKENGEDWCKQKNIDFWNYGAGENKGWAQKINPNLGNKPMIWQNLITLAASQRVNLIASFNAKIQGGEVQIPAMTFKTEKDQPNIPGVERVKDAKLGGGVDSFVGFTYSVACSVTEVDILTGEVKIISSDIIYDMGWSMNPAIDIGQIEGAFVQGIGYLMTEKLVAETKGTNIGRLNSTNTWRYKIPAVTTIPLEMNTFLFPRDEQSVSSIPADPNQIFSAKEVGEPPLVLANSVFFAIKDAIRESRKERKLPDLFQFDAPATVQEVRRACQVSLKDLSE